MLLNQIDGQKVKVTILAYDFHTVGDWLSTGLV